MKNKKILLSLLITAVLIVGVGSWIGSGIVEPAMYRKSMSTGAEYLKEQKYEEALTQFQKAVQLHRESTQGRLGMAYAYLGLGNSNEAANVLQRAQQEALKDESFLLECLDALYIPEPKSAYVMLKRYVEAVGEDALSEKVQNLWDGSKTVPEQPEITPEPAAYASVVTVSLNRQDVQIGHHYYFTLDGTQPDKKSFSYREPIVLSADTTLSIIGYNAEGEAGEIKTYTYEVDTSLRQKLKRIYSQAIDATGTVEVGENAGQVSQEGMDRLKKQMYATEKVLALELLTAEEAEKSYKSIGEAFTFFEEEIVPETDKTKLNTQIEKAEKLIKEEGDNEQVKTEIQSLKSLLQDAKSVYDDRTATQDEVDSSRKKLTSAIAAVEEAKKKTQITTSDEPLNITMTWTSDVSLRLQVVTPLGDTVGSGSEWSFTSGGRMQTDGQKEGSGGYTSQVGWTTPPTGSYEIRVISPDKAEGRVDFLVQVTSDSRRRSFSGSVSPGKQKTYTFTY